MAAKNSFLAIPLTSIDASTFAGAFLPINATGLPESCLMVRIVNNSNKDVTISYDGVTAHDFIPTLTSVQLAAQVNGQPNNFSAQFKAGTVVWVKAAAGTGLVYLSGYYQPTQ